MTAQNATRATLLVLPLLWACYLLTAVLYTAALLVTSSLIRQAEAGDRPNYRRAMNYLRSERVRWKSFILRFLATLLAAAVLMWLCGYLIFRPALIGRFGGRPIGYAIGFLLEAFVAIALMPSTLRLLATSSSLDLKPLRQPAIVLGLTTIGLQIILTTLGDRIIPVILAKQTSSIGFLLCEATPSLLGALTYLPLFIGLSLLTAAPADEALAVE